MEETYVNSFTSLIESIGSGIGLFGNSLGIIAYVLEALALYTIAKRRGIKNPWMAWIPLVNVWILGSLSDQYRYVTKGEVKSKRKAMLVLNIVSVVLVIVMIVAMVSVFINTIDWSDVFYGLENDSGDYWSDNGYTDAFEGVFGMFTGMAVVLLVTVLPLLGVTIASKVLRWMSIYDVFRSCDPKNTTVYFLVSLLVGIFALQGLESVFMLICMNKDCGMPPRKQEPQPQSYIPPVEEPFVDRPENNGPEF